MSPAAKRSEFLPEQIGPYKVESYYKRGGMCHLYLSSHPVTHDPIVIKVLGEKFLENKEAVRRFINEAEILSKTDHPNIVRAINYGRWDDGYYIALDFVDGESLHEFIQHNTMSFKRTVEVILEIAYAVCHLHTHGLIHRDLKPENIIIHPDGAIKLVDLGVAQMLSDRRKELTDQELHFVGTPIYMSPEQKNSPDKVSYASDIYSLAIIAYELILGKLSRGKIHLALMPKGLQKILSKALQPVISDRYNDIVDFISDLSAYLNSDALEKERLSGDRLSELSEHLHQAQYLILPPQTPNWSGIDISVKMHTGIGVSGVYYDFFELAPNRYGVLMAEAVSMGVEGVIKTAALSGMVKGLCRLTAKPGDLFDVINDLLIRDENGLMFSINYLVISTDQKMVEFLSCGQGNLWYHQANEPFSRVVREGVFLGEQPLSKFNQGRLKWEKGCQIFIHTDALLRTKKHPQAPFNETEAQSLLNETRETPPQKQMEQILRYAGTADAPFIERHAIAMMSLRA